MADFDENLIEIKECKILGKLPDPFLMDDGSRVKNVEDWEKRRREIYKTAIEMQYGTMPPEPEFLKVEAIYKLKRGGSWSYRITTGKKDHPISFIMRVKLPVEDGLFPAVIDGDLCFDYAFDKEFTNTFLDENIALVLFNRTELANDIVGEGRGHGPLYEVYPEYTFGSLGAWAWGYSRCVDALEQLGIVDMNCIAFTGHSRGGKTAALAGALDERAAIVNPNASCAGACSCYRLHLTAVTEDGDVKTSETLGNILQKLDFWFAEGMHDYADREQDLPFDSHYLKALVAPRILFVSEAASDIWSNPVGSWMTSMAATEVYKLYNKPENLYWYFRRGYHYHKIEDIKMLVNIIKHMTEGRELSDNFFKTPFKKPELAYDWRCPTVEDK